MLPQLEEQHILKSLVTKIGRDFENFLVEHHLCPLCLGDLKKLSGEIVCISCGLTIEDIDFQANIPFGKEHEHYQPTNQLAFGKGLGNTIDERRLWVVLAHSDDSSWKWKDMPLRSRHIRVISQSVDHPKIMTLLKYGRKKLHDNGFDEHQKPECVIISNHYGRMLRRIGAYLILTKQKVHLSTIADACFIVTMKTLQHEKYLEISADSNVPPPILEYVEKLDGRMKLELRQIK